MINKYPVISHLFQWYLSVYLHVYMCVYTYIYIYSIYIYIYTHTYIYIYIYIHILYIYIHNIYIHIYIYTHIYIYIYINIPTILASIFPLSSHRSFHWTKLFGSASARATSSSSVLRKGSWKRLQKSQKIARSTALPGAAISWGCYSACWCQVWIDIPSKKMCWDYDEYKCIYIYIYAYIKSYREGTRATALSLSLFLYIYV